MADEIHHLTLGEGSAVVLIEGRRSRSPDECHDAFGDHGAVEHRLGVLLVFQAACHHGRLRGMGTADGTAGYRHEHHREYGRGVVFRAETLPHLGQCRPSHQQGHQYHDGHEKQADGENRVDFADDLVNWKQRGDKVIAEDDGNPEIGIHVERQGYTSCSRFRHMQRPDDDVGRLRDEDRTSQRKEKQHEDNHHFLDVFAEVTPYELRQALAVVAQRHDARDEVMYGAAENGAEHNPKIGGRAELRAHDGTEDWTETRNVEKLNHEDFPGGHGNEIDAVGPCHGWRGILRVDVDDAGDVSPVDKVTHYEDY